MRFDGEINRLVVVAGFRGSGKSTLLGRSSELLPEHELPPSLADFHEFAPEHRQIGRLSKRSGKDFDTLYLHVDLTVPLVGLKVASRKELVDRLKPKRYEDWHELSEFLRIANSVEVVTLFVDRQTHFERWIGRSLRSHRGGSVRNVVAMINGDTRSGSELHRLAFEAWFRFVERRRLRHYVLDGREEPYRFRSVEELDYSPSVRVREVASPESASAVYCSFARS